MTALPSCCAACSLEAASLPEKLAVTSGGNGKQRLLLRNAAVQLQDCYGNAATGGGVQVRLAASQRLHALSAWRPDVAELKPAEAFIPADTPVI